MTDVQTIEIEALHALTIVPRITLVFSRRRIALQRIEMVADDGQVRIRLVAACSQDLAHRVVKQLERIVEVRSAELQSIDAPKSDLTAETRLPTLALASAVR